MGLIYKDSLELPQTFKAALVLAQRDLWSDLAEARRSAIGGEWSIACGNLAARIVDIAHLVGHTPWDQVPETLLYDGVYLALVREAALPITLDEVEALERYLAAGRARWSGAVVVLGS